MKSNRSLTCCVCLLGLLASYVFCAPVEGAGEGKGVGAEGDSLAIDLVNSTFHAEVGKVSEEQSILMEFYASWCPACRHFKPDFEKIANYFNKVPRVKPEVWVARVDCATEHELCRIYEVKSYPTMLLGQPQDFRTDSVTKLQKYSGSREPSHIIKWIANYTKGTYDFKDEAYHSEQEFHQLKSKLSTTKYTEESLEDIEKATLLAFEEIVQADLEGKRLAVIEIFTLLQTAHPSKRCQEGLSELVSNFNKYWKPTLSEPEETLKSYKVCGDVVGSSLNWKQCKGSREDTRGFTCGLWMLFHSLSTRVEEQLGGLTWLRGVEAYIRHFFGCSTCQKHFMEMITTQEAQAISSRSDAVIWMWQSHNKVNKRLGDEEQEKGTGDPDFPKVQWPPASLCSDCYLTNNEQEPAWSYPHVYKFLMHYYGGVEIEIEPESKFHKFTQPNIKPLDAAVNQQESLRGNFQNTKGQNIQEKENRSILYPLVVISVVVVSLLYCMRRERSATSAAGLYDRTL